MKTMFLPQGRLSGPLKIALLYLAVSLLWVYGSHLAVQLLVTDPSNQNLVSAGTRSLFLIATAGLLYTLLKRQAASYQTTTERLRKGRQELLDILDALPVGIVLTDGVTIEYININFSERFGYSLDEIPTDEQWFLLAFPDCHYRSQEVGGWRADVERARLRGGAIAPLDVKITCKDGQRRHVIINTNLIDNRLVLILTDITERELLRNELIKMQKLESIGVLAGGIAHDFNNILTGIMGNLSYARLLIDPDHPAEPPLEAAEQASRNAAALTRQLLTFAKGGEPVKEVVAVERLVTEAATLMLRGTNVRAKIQIASDVRAIEADTGQISQVLNNVAINAVQAMPDGGVLRFEADNLQLEEGNPMALAAGAYVRMIITDQGCGIPEAILGRVFDPYFSTKETGSGLGLASAYSIVTRHGGHIGLDPGEERGTVCTILLPASDKLPLVPDIVEAPAVPADRSCKHQSILVMDDEVTIRTLAATMLQYMGYEVRTCADGKEALDLYASARTTGQPYAAVLMDLTIPGGMGGLETARHLLALDPEACLIVSSGYSHDPVLAHYPSHGFTAMLTKPYSVTELEQTLQRALSLQCVRTGINPASGPLGPARPGMKLPKPIAMGTEHACVAEVRGNGHGLG